MAHDLDVIRQAIEERDAALQAWSDLANEMVYRGNSVAWWHSKATAYRDAIDRCWDALRDAGIHPDGKTDVATAIRQLAERSNVKYTPFKVYIYFQKRCINQSFAYQAIDI